MLVQVLVVLVALWLLFFAARQKASAVSALKKIGISLLAVVMVITVLFPSLTTTLANLLGIGRGADLLLYGLAATFVVYAITQYARAQANRRVLFGLARRIALRDARARYFPGDRP
ncbi:MAG: DUF2304 domain-containing protein [Propioniciclava sp.]|uniref:DUF2304 family protein n=1 Tax=Propioniciclava sp. TaxID=2038686 RepID=UPI0039E2DBDB